MPVNVPEDLLLLARAGDLKALENLLHPFDGELRRSIAAQIAAKWRHLIEPEDVIQVTYYEIILRPSQLPVQSDRIAAWLHNAAVHNLRDMVRALEAAKRGGADRPLTSNAEGLDILDLCPTAIPTATRTVRKQEVEAMIRAAVEDLPPAMRAVIVSCYFQGNSVNEAAAMANRTVGYVYGMRAKAEQRLAEMLAGQTSQFFSAG